MAKIKVAVAGCLGRMGQEISNQILSNKNLEFVGGFEHKKHKDINKSLNKVSSVQSSKLVSSNSIQLIKEANVIIDFTTPESTLDNLKTAAANKTAVVIGTTGMTDMQKKKVKNYSKKIPILMSSNMSLGVNLLVRGRGRGWGKCLATHARYILPKNQDQHASHHNPERHFGA